VYDAAYGLRAVFVNFAQVTVFGLFSSSPYYTGTALVVAVVYFLWQVRAHRGGLRYMVAVDGPWLLGIVFSYLIRRWVVRNWWMMFYRCLTVFFDWNIRWGWCSPFVAHGYWSLVCLCGISYVSGFSSTGCCNVRTSRLCVGDVASDYIWSVSLRIASGTWFGFLRGTYTWAVFSWL
jgi:hypothetical protein